MSITDFFATKKRARPEGEASPDEPSPKRTRTEEPDEPVPLVSTFADLHLTIPRSCSWRRFLDGEFGKRYFRDLKSFLVEEEEAGKTIYPPINDVFSIFCHCDVADIKVVILGQDPYHGPGQAHGLSFSVRKGIRIPASLRNIYKELATDITGFVAPNHGCLIEWAKQGVFLLNDVLTVVERTAHAHKGQGWETFTAAVISHIDQHCRGVAFLLWGNHAKKKSSSINQQKHRVITCPHPSPFSARYGFFGSKCFSKANAYLTSQARQPIDWKRF